MSALYKTAGRLARRAVAADKERDWTNAITLYMLACEYLIGAAKHDRIPTRREMIKQRISAYLTRTEELKALVCPAAAPQASTTPAASQYNPVSDRAAVGEDRVLPKEFTAAGGDGIGWDDVGGLEGAKDVLDEALVFPQKHPELFKGKRQPWKGVLLFGPPGTGKTLVVKAAAKECGLPVAFISASDLVSKWQGQSERALKQLFENARRTKPCVIFVDEIDSIGRTRQEGEHESARRLKTELLRQLDGVGANNDGVTFIAATNTPWELDPALRRRFDQMVYMPLPDAATREKVLRIHLEGQDSVVTPADFAAAAARAKGYSAADLQIVAREALMLPIRRALKSKYFKQVSVQPPGEMWKRTMWVPATKWERGAKRKHMLELDPESVLVGQVSGKDLQAALASVAPSVSQEELRRYEEFKTKFRARDGAARSGARVALRGASAAAPTRGVAAGAGVGAGAGAGSARVPAMPDAPTGGLLSSFANAIAGWFSSAPAPAPAVRQRSASSNGRRLVPG